MIPNMSKRFVLETDASNTGIAAVLLQDRRPVAYISRLLKNPGLRYSITGKELLAPLWAIKKLEYFLKGREFDLLTDHKALREINKNKNMRHR